MLFLYLPYAARRHIIASLIFAAAYYAATRFFTLRHYFATRLLRHCLAFASSSWLLAFFRRHLPANTPPHRLRRSRRQPATPRYFAVYAFRRHHAFLRFHFYCRHYHYAAGRYTYAALYHMLRRLVLRWLFRFITPPRCHEDDYALWQVAPYAARY